MAVSSADIAIVGAGPIGIELAVALKKEGINYLHFDARQVGFTISWFAPQTRFFSSNERIAIASVPLFTPDQTKCTREQYLAYLRTIVQEFDLHINTYEPVTTIRSGAEGFTLTTRRGAESREFIARKIVLATGGTERPRTLNVPGCDLPHVSHYFQDPHTYFRQRLLIVGGRNSAVEAALRSHHAGAHVAISYRRPAFDAASIKYWLWPEMNGLIGSGKLDAHLNSTVKEIRARDVVLQENGRDVIVPADFVLLLIGYEADMSLCKMAGVELRDGGQVPAFNPATMETNVPGLYVAGTAVAGTQGKYSVFIENCHVHTQRIMASLLGRKPPSEAEVIERPES
jgi:thioredoxin reductase (NADPH)